jgi:hypothetical protein
MNQQIGNQQEDESTQPPAPARLQASTGGQARPRPVRAHQEREPYA